MESSGLGLSKTCCPLSFQKVVLQPFKSMRLSLLKSMKIMFGRNFCYSRAPADPMKYHKSQKNPVCSRFRLPIGENRPFLAENVGARTLDLFL